MSAAMYREIYIKKRQFIDIKHVVLVYLRVLHQNQTGRNKQKNKGSTLYKKTAWEIFYFLFFFTKPVSFTAHYAAMCILCSLYLKHWRRAQINKSSFGPKLANPYYYFRLI